jgi:subtilisin family serine protease
MIPQNVLHTLHNLNKKVFFKMKLEKLSISLRNVINLSIDEIKTLPEKQRCGLLAMEIDEEFIPAARVIIVLNEKNEQLTNLPKQYIVDQKAQFVVGEIPFEIIKELTEDSKVKHIDKPSALYPDLDDALFWSGADEVISQNLQSQNLNENLDGEGVLIGLIDSGINYLHPDFSFEVDGSLETNIEGIWLPSGTEWTREEINTAINSDNPQDIVPHLDFTGHGTLVAACAASTGRGSGYKGVAPKAGILMAASSSGNLETADESNSYLLAIRWFEQKATELNKPIVINISKGSNDGPRDGSLPFEGYLDAVIEANNNLVICKTAGNHGNKKHHATGNAKVDDENSTQPTVEVVNRLSSFFIDIWYEAEDSFTIELINPEGLTTGIVEENPINLGVLNFMDGNGVIDNEMNINVTYEPENQTLNGAKHFQFLLNLREGTNGIPLGEYQVRIRPSSNESAPNGNYHCWLDYTRFSGMNDVVFLPPYQTDSYTLNAGACGMNTIIVGNWNDYSGERNPTSSLGLTRDGRNGVSVIAPGTEIVGAAHSRALEYSAEPFIQVRTGTSFACPIVSGIAALIYQEALLLNPTQALPSFSEIR